MRPSLFRPAALLMLSLALAACGNTAMVGRRAPATVEGYGPLQDGNITLPAVEREHLEGVNRRVMVPYGGPERPGTLVVDPFAKFLFLVQPEGQAIRYPIAVGRAGRGLRGTATVGRKAEWPGWTPTDNMLRNEPEVYRGFARGIPGGIASPLGARALYLYRGSTDTHFRIHGTNDRASIGNSTSAGCIRMFNQDIIDLYQRVPVGARLVVRTYPQSVAAEGEELANRGKEMPPTIVSPAVVYAAVEAERQRNAQLAAAPQR